MNRIPLVFRHEIYSLVSRPSFWFGALGVPLIGFMIFAVVNMINASQAPEVESPVSGIAQLFTPEEDLRPEGYVDAGGLVEEIPAWADTAALIRYSSEAEARQALDDETISAFYVISPNYLETGRILAYTKEFSLISSGSGSGDLSRMIEYNLLGGDEDLAAAVSDPLPDDQVETVSLAPPPVGPVRDPDSMMTFYLPYGVMMLFYISILGAAGMLLNSVTKEKENRVMEVLMSSIDPHQLLLGKIGGMGVVGMIQVVIWGLSAFTLLRLSGQAFNFSEAFMLQPAILAWGLVFFILGYLVYAALMAGIGALVPNLREASQATTIVIMPLIIPLFVISALIDSPNSPLTTFLSIFPLTSPTTMMLRLSATNDVPLWQILLSIVLLIITSLIIIRTVSGMFRAQTLLSGQPFKIRRYLLALVGKGTNT